MDAPSLIYTAPTYKSHREERPQLRTGNVLLCSTQLQYATHMGKTQTQSQNGGLPLSEAGEWGPPLISLFNSYIQVMWRRQTPTQIGGFLIICIQLLHTSHMEKADAALNGDSLHSIIHVLYTSHMERQTPSRNGCRLLFSIHSYIQVTSRKHTPTQNGSPFLYSIQLLYTIHIEKAYPLSEFGLPSFLHTTPIYNSHREGRAQLRMGASFSFSIQLLYTTHI